MNYGYITRPIEQNYQDRGPWLVDKEGYIGQMSLSTK